MAFNFGGPTMVQTSADETAAARENRDVEQRGADQKYTEGVGLAGATLTNVASTAVGGRKNRDYLQQGAGNHRNDYLYVNYANGISALSGAKSPTFDASKANTGLYPF